MKLRTHNSTRAPLDPPTYFSKLLVSRSMTLLAATRLTKPSRAADNDTVNLIISNKVIMTVMNASTQNKFHVSRRLMTFLKSSVMNPPSISLSFFHLPFLTYLNTFVKFRRTSVGA
jgi:hypothetical protein